MRVTLAESEKVVSQSRGLRKFRGEPNNNYRLVFPSDGSGGPILYLNKVHKINLGAVRGRARCVQDYVVVDENTKELKLDPVTGRPLNDGSCPYCELMHMHRVIINNKMEKFKAENPNATEKEEKDYYKEIMKSAPVEFPVFLRGFIVAKIATDPTGRQPVLHEGVPQFELQFLPMTENQYEKKFKTALTQLESIDYCELMFTYPDGDKMSSAKDLQIQPTLKPFIDQYPKLKEQIAEAVENLDLDIIEEKIFEFRPESIPTIERKIAPVSSAISAQLSEEEKEELKVKISNNLISAEAATLADLEKSTLMGDLDDEDTDNGDDSDIYDDAGDGDGDEVPLI